MRINALLVPLLLVIISCKHSPPGIRVKHLHEFDSTLNYRIDIDYPTFLSRNSGKLNERVIGQIDSNIFEFKKFILDFEGYSTRSLTYQYQIKTNSSQVVSLNQLFEWAVPGVERILYQHCCINFDLSRNQFIEIGNLFKSGLNYRDSLRVVVESQLKKDSICNLDSSEYFENYYFSDDTIFFNLTFKESSPRCDGYTVAISKNDLRGVLK